MDLALQAISYFGGHPWLAVLILFSMNMVFLPVMEEFNVMVGGYLAAQLTGSWPLTMLAAWFGMVITDYWSFLLARWFGKPLVNSRFFRWVVPPAKLEKALEKVDKYGARIVFIIRFVPGGIRVPVFMACGLSKVRHGAFLLNSGLGAALVMQITFWIGYTFGGNVEAIQALATQINNVGKVVIISVIALVVLAVGVIWLYKKKHSQEKQ